MKEKVSVIIPVYNGEKTIKNCLQNIIKNNKSLKKEIIVSYGGPVPNLFSEGKGVVAEGELIDKKYFVADAILAKHDENYMPPEVTQALEKSNY